ncbi:uncharacterized protein HD556DRAFT_1441156 [Suillus plorans]|uniref:Uncharacterized protein n=1 Tax=Suillus plorans TaxID=116603 RepID=A0A9P7IXL3_9AGAM|nr:uncharacterized protein HD556DRAFT_1441156 [Suillus plorans]KAG1796980.1 hypothetical protein HD556DRAFT_1441156 [Suillus plorans]
MFTNTTVNDPRPGPVDTISLSPDERIVAADGKFLVTNWLYGQIHIWDVSAILNKAGLLSDIVDGTPRPAPKLKGTPPGFFVLIYYRPLFVQRNYRARKKKPTTSSFQRPKTHATQQHSGATRNTRSLSQLPPPTATTTASPHITIRVAGWRARFMVWVCCIPIQNADGQLTFSFCVLSVSSVVSLNSS